VGADGERSARPTNALLGLGPPVFGEHAAELSEHPIRNSNDDVVGLRGDTTVDDQQVAIKDPGAAHLRVSADHGWRRVPHTCRSFLTGLRKKGRHLERAKREDGLTVYKLVSVAALVR
jgi:hypothetical protein